MANKEINRETMKIYQEEAKTLGISLLEYLLFIVSERLREIAIASNIH